MCLWHNVKNLLQFWCCSLQMRQFQCIIIQRRLKHAKSDQLHNVLQTIYTDC